MVSLTAKIKASKQEEEITKQEVSFGPLYSNL